MSTRTGRNERPLFRLVLVMALSTLIVSSPVAGIPQGTAKRKVACKIPENAASCYWAHGRLSIYNGAPSYRLWKIGAHRILGIYSGPDAQTTDALDAEHPGLPADLERASKSLPTEVFADFEICPLEPEQAGVMQAACIESAKNIFAIEPK